ncbi:MAG TPA: glutaredoxin family protein [Mariprofundaceae bacterium]|nr:glutaredoxin family protein [Mariprofundaceae bacterium]
MSRLPCVQVLGRAVCGLCDEAKAVVQQVAGDGLCEWESVDVDRDADLLARFGQDVPVVLINGELRFKHRITAEGLRTALREVSC